MWKKMLLLFSGMLLMLGACGSQEEAALRAGAAAENEEGRRIFLSFNGEIQGFEAESSGLVQNIVHLAWLAPRGGLGMEAEAEKVPESENPCLLESGSMADTEEILPSESGLVWVRITGGEDIDSGEGTSAPEHGDIAEYIQGGGCVYRGRSCGRGLVGYMETARIRGVDGAGDKDFPEGHDGDGGLNYPDRLRSGGGNL